MLRSVATVGWTRVSSIHGAYGGRVGVRLASTAATREPIVVSSSKNGVTTVRMNNPGKFNAWTKRMMDGLFDAMNEAAADDSIKVVVLTGTDPYYCAGVDLSATLKPMAPKKLHEMIRVMNQHVFDSFIHFPKPIIVANNGPAIGASVTTGTLCDAIVASPKATYSTPFSALGVPAEGCSSVTFAKLLGEEAAQRMLGPEGWQPTAVEAKEIGMVTEVVSEHDQLLDRAQALGEEWAAQNKQREYTVPGFSKEELLAINARESRELADAFLAEPFLQGQLRFARKRGKTQLAMVFATLIATRPVWSLML